jgi:hypothetical protein
LVNAVKNIETVSQLLAWLLGELESSDDMLIWEMLMVQEVAMFQKEISASIGLLWELARGKKLSRGTGAEEQVNEAIEDYWTLPYNSTEFAFTLLYPRKDGEQWYVQPVLADYEEYLMILFLESLRQQLDEGIGIICPNVSCIPSVSCNCEDNPARKEAVQRLAQWAREGKFGRGASLKARGEWTTTWPFPCI